MGLGAIERRLAAVLAIAGACAVDEGARPIGMSAPAPESRCPAEEPSDGDECLGDLSCFYYSAYAVDCWCDAGQWACEDEDDCVPLGCGERGDGGHGLGGDSGSGAGGHGSVEYQWEVVHSGDGSTFVHDLALDGDDNIGGGSISSDGQRRGFVARYSADGSFELGDVLDGSVVDEGQSEVIALDFGSNGELTVTGHFEGSVVFDGGVSEEAPGAAASIFLARIAANGGIVWHGQLATSVASQVNAVAVDNSDYALVAGELRDTLSVGAVTLISQGGTDGFFVKMGPIGNCYAGFAFGDANEQRASAVGLDGSDNLIVAGTLSGNADFGNGPIGGGHDDDLFIAKYAP